MRQEASVGGKAEGSALKSQRAAMRAVPSSAPSRAFYTKVCEKSLSTSRNVLLTDPKTTFFSSSRSVPSVLFRTGLTF